MLKRLDSNHLIEIHRFSIKLLLIQSMSQGKK